MLQNTHVKKKKRESNPNVPEIRLAIIEVLKREFFLQNSLPLCSLAQQLNEIYQQEQQTELSQKISEEEFISLINQMVAAGDIMQIKQNFSLPYQFANSDAYQSLLSQNGSTASSNKSAQIIEERKESQSHSPAPKRDNTDHKQSSRNKVDAISFQKQESSQSVKQERNDPILSGKSSSTSSHKKMAKLARSKPIKKDKSKISPVEEVGKLTQQPEKKRSPLRAVSQSQLNQQRKNSVKTTPSKNKKASSTKAKQPVKAGLGFITHMAEISRS